MEKEYITSTYNIFLIDSFLNFCLLYEAKKKKYFYLSAISLSFSFK